jgi:hypothetical protein
MLLALAATILAQAPIKFEATLVDARKSTVSEQTTLATLQAIVNRREPRLMVLFRDESQPWVRPVEGRLGASMKVVEPTAALEGFKKQVKGQILYDPTDGFSRNLATTLAGLETSVATEKDLGLPTKADLRGKWKTRAEAYRWALAELLPRCSKKELANLDDEIPCFRDVIADRKLFTVNLDPINNVEEGQLLEEILAKFPPLTPVFGWASGKFADASKGQTDVTVEHAFVERLSKRNLLLIPSDFADNVTLFAQLPVMEKPRQSRRSILSDLGKAHVCLIVSDGDNLQYNLNKMRELWTSAGWPRVPLGWTISPQWAELAPALLDLYYQEAAQRGGTDEFVMGPSGLAYVNPGSMTPASLKEFAKRTVKASKTADLRSVVTLDRRDRPRAEIETFLKAYSDAGLAMVWLADMPPYQGTSGRMPYLGESVRLGGDGRAAARAVKESLKASKQVFVYVHAWELTAPNLASFVDELGDAARLVTPSEMVSLIRPAK